MYRLIVVDDEAIIADGLCEVIKYNGRFELDVYKAYSAYEALDLINKYRIDIIISDICLPGMTGLELLDKVIGLWPDIKFIFLTGYNEFDYIQFAIRKGVVDFILKNEGDNKVFDALQKAVNALERDIYDKDFIEKTKRQMKLAAPMLQNHYLLNLLNGLHSDEEERNKQFGELDIPLDSNQDSLLIIGRMDTVFFKLDYIKKIELIYGIGNVFEEYLSMYVSSIMVTHESGKYIWFVQPKCITGTVPPYEDTLKHILNSMDPIQTAIYNVFGVWVSFIVSVKPVCWDNIDLKFNLLKLELDKTAGITDKVLLIEGESSIGTPNGYNYLVRKQLAKIELLQMHLESGQEKEFTALIKDVLESVQVKNSVPYFLVAEVYYAVANVYLRHINSNGLTSKLEASGGIELERLLKIDRHVSWDKAIEYFLCLARIIFKQKADELFKTNDQVVHHITKYIHQNLDGDLSLTKLGELFHFNSSYLSRIFKHLTGKNMSEYITAVKLEKAMDMLKNSNLKIGEIGSAIGFTTSSYFTRFFRRFADITPQEFRNQYRRNEVNER